MNNDIEKELKDKKISELRASEEKEYREYSREA